MSLPKLGIDSAKAKFNVFLHLIKRQTQAQSFPNTEAGYALLSAWLLNLRVKRVQACLQATGTYGETLSLYPYEHNHLVGLIEE